MEKKISYMKQLKLSCLILSGFFTISMVYAEEKIETQYPDTVKIQIGYYFIADTNTEVAVNSTVGNIGTVIELERDLDIDDKLGIPRIDAYYRFNNNHRIDFSWFSIDRKGTKTISLDFIYNGELFSASESIASEIQTDFYKVAYAYSFYHNPKVELSITAGLNLLTYKIGLNNLSTGNNQSAEVTAPLPVFGLRMDYSITPQWSVLYRVETFYIDINDKFRGSLIDAEVGTEYRFTKHIALGLSLTRFAIDAKIKSPKYTGGLNDLYRGINLFGIAYF